MVSWSVKKNENKYVRLSELASRYGLSFSSKMKLADKIIALDSAKKKLMVVELVDKTESINIVDLNEVKTISFQQTYENIEAGELRKKEIDEFVTSIQLQFEFHNELKKSSLLFFKKTKHFIRDLAKYRRNAKSWYMILSRLINPESKRIKMHESSLA